MINITKIISLGPNCHTAGILKILNYKTESYPFDWIISNIDIVIDCIITDFKNYINKELFYIYNQLIIGHKLYKHNMFVHRDPLHNDNDYNYILRCTERFKQLYNNNNILFIHTIYNNEYDINNLIKLKEILNTKIDSCYLLILNYIKISNDDEKYKYIINILYKNIYLISINITYDINKEYDIDHSIMNFYKNNNPISEIFLYSNK